MRQLRKGYEVDVPLLSTDDLGDNVPVDGVPVWVLSDTSLFTLNIAEGGLSAVLRGTGDVIGGTATVTATADADLGEGVVHLTVTEEWQLTSGQATNLVFGAGEPRPIVT